MTLLALATALSATELPVSEFRARRTEAMAGYEILTPGLPYSADEIESAVRISRP
jgi:hypothetical protein